jgi:hypothetical protein
MKEEMDMNPSAVPDEPGTDLVSLMRTMQQHLLLLEKKMDLLLSRSKEKSFEGRPSHGPSFGKRPFSKPPRSYDHSQHQDKREREHGPRDRDSAPGHFYERRPQEKGRRSNPRNKPFAFKRKDRE